MELPFTRCFVGQMVEGRFRWMASPYLPVAQAFFAAVYRLAPDSPFSFQVAAALLDLLTGLLVIDLLHRLGLPRTWALIYLWNPLVVVEFAHGAHLDALMICLVMAAFWLLIARMSASAMSASRARSALLSAVALAAATLTKGLPALLLPVLARRYGEGLFGALRIYTATWNFYGGLYHWLEAGLSTCWASGTAPSEAAGWVPTLIARLTVLVALCLVVMVVWRRGRRCTNNLALLRLAAVSLAAYLLVATTVHPWYVTFVISLLPFLPSRGGEAARRRRLVVPWLYFSAVVSLTYLTYLDPANPRESDLVRLVEYVPLYVLLVWSAWPASGGAHGTGAD
jgi:alpha-1,6-mannosyltransferase